MSKKSAGLLLYQVRNKSKEVFLVHPGGPFWKNKDLGSWSIPKGEFAENEDPLEAAKREFEEETGFSIDGKFIKLTPAKQKSGKIIFAWAVRGDVNTENTRSNTFEPEWPPHSGKKQEFPEIDKSKWFTISQAKEKINPGQLKLIEELMTRIAQEE
jgi:predicted NUDIX family NTP pyrophosphohydrolase